VINGLKLVEPYFRLGLRVIRCNLRSPYIETDINDSLFKSKQAINFLTLTSSSTLIFANLLLSTPVKELVGQYLMVMKVDGLLGTFYPRDAMYIARSLRQRRVCLSVLLSVVTRRRLTVPSRAKAGSWMHHLIAPWFYTVSKKLWKLIFCHNFAKFRRIVKIFGTKIAERTSFSEVYSFSTSLNLCQHTTVWNADVQNCYITL